MSAPPVIANLQPWVSIILDVLFNVVPSPSEHVFIKKYDGSVFPKFQQLFEVPPEQSPLKFLALDPTDSATALVIENRSGKAITAFCYRWIRGDASGKAAAAYVHIRQLHG
jgi:hypothetical protein